MDFEDINDDMELESISTLKAEEANFYITEMYNRHKDTVKFATPLPEDMMCCICGRFLIYAHHNKDLDSHSCHFCHSCLQKLQSGPGKCIHHPDRSVAKKLMTVKTEQPDFQKILVEIDGSKTLYSLSYIINNYQHSMGFHSEKTSARDSFPSDTISNNEVSYEQIEQFKEDSKRMLTDGENQIKEVAQKQEQSLSRLRECDSMASSITKT